MNTPDHQSISRLIPLIICLFGLPGCQSDSQRAKALLAEANTLAEQESRVTKQWTAEYKKGFSPESVAQFPSNRELLRTHAEKIITLLDESAKLTAQISEKFEQAAAHVTEVKGKKGLSLFAAALKKDLEMNALLKEQMRLVSNDQIKDRKTFEEKFRSLMTAIQQKRKERDSQQDEAKTLMGLR